MPPKRLAEGAVSPSRSVQPGIDLERELSAIMDVAAEPTAGAPDEDAEAAKDRLKMLKLAGELSQEEKEKKKEEESAEEEEKEEEEAKKAEKEAKRAEKEAQETTRKAAAAAKRAAKKAQQDSVKAAAAQAEVHKRLRTMKRSTSPAPGSDAKKLRRSSAKAGAEEHAPLERTENKEEEEEESKKAEKEAKKAEKAAEKEKGQKVMAQRHAKACKKRRQGEAATGAVGRARVAPPKSKAKAVPKATTVATTASEGKPKAKGRR